MIVTADLISALEQRRIAGAALDVFDNEPQVPDAFKGLANVILTPACRRLVPGGHPRHRGTGRQKNLTAFFSGQPVLTPIALPPPTAATLHNH